MFTQLMKLFATRRAINAINRSISGSGGYFKSSWIRRLTVVQNEPGLIIWPRRVVQRDDSMTCSAESSLAYMSNLFKLSWQMMLLCWDISRRRKSTICFPSKSFQTCFGLASTSTFCICQSENRITDRDLGGGER